MIGAHVLKGDDLGVRSLVDEMALQPMAALARSHHRRLLAGRRGKLVSRLDFPMTRRSGRRG